MAVRKEYWGTLPEVGVVYRYYISGEGSTEWKRKKRKASKKTSLSPAMTVQLPLFIRNSSRLRMKAKPEPF